MWEFCDLLYKLEDKYDQLKYFFLLDTELCI